MKVTKYIKSSDKTLFSFEDPSSTQGTKRPELTCWRNRSTGWNSIPHYIDVTITARGIWFYKKRANGLLEKSTRQKTGPWDLARPS